MKITEKKELKIFRIITYTVEQDCEMDLFAKLTYWWNKKEEDDNGFKYSLSIHSQICQLIL